MIARTWRVRTRLEHGAAYHEYLLRTGVANCRATSGNLGVYLLKRDVGDEAEFLFISLWESMEAVGRFAGPQAEAVFYPEDEEYLTDFDREVFHYDVLEAP